MYLEESLQMEADGDLGKPLNKSFLKDVEKSLKLYKFLN